MLAPWKKSYDQTRQHIKKQRHCFANKGLSSQGYGFSSSHAQIWEVDHKEAWALKNWCFHTVVLEKTLESSLGNKEIQPVNAKGNQCWIFIGRMNSEALVLWPPDMNSGLTGKTLMLVKIEGRRSMGRQRLVWLDSITDSMDMNLSKLWEIVKDRGAWHAAIHWVTNSQTWLSYWTITT